MAEILTTEIPTTEIPTITPSSTQEKPDPTIGLAVEKHFDSPGSLDDKLRDFAVGLAPGPQDFSTNVHNSEMNNFENELISVDLKDIATFLKEHDSEKNIADQLPEDLSFNFITDKDGKLVPVIASSELTQSQLSILYEEQGNAAREARVSLAVREQQITEQKNKQQKERELLAEQQAKILIATLARQVSDKLRFIGKHIDSSIISEEVFTLLRRQIGKGAFDKRAIDATVEEVYRSYTNTSSIVASNAA